MSRMSRFYEELAAVPAPAATPPVSVQAAQDEDSDFDLILEPGRAAAHYWLDLWRYRELFHILAGRDITIRYKQTVVGVAWVLIQPLVTMLIMTMLFGRVAGLKSAGTAPYALLVFSGMLPWTFFGAALGNASQSMVSNASLISKVYFPRLIIPASAVVTSFADLLVQLVILVGMMLWYWFAPSWNLLLLPVFIVLTGLVILGPGLLLTALNVRYRDFRFVMPFVMQIGFYVTPVAYRSDLIRAKFGELAYEIYSLNPMVGIIDAFRWCILGSKNSPFNFQSLGVTLGVTAVSLLVGLWYFRKTEKTMADVI